MLNFLYHDIAKTLFFNLGIIVAFVLNKHCTFEKYDKNYKQFFQFAILHSTTLFANVMENRLILNFAGQK
jgi:putative flippase GtrA